MAEDIDVARVAEVLRAPLIRYRTFGNGPTRTPTSRPVPAAPSVPVDALVAGAAPSLHAVLNDAAPHGAEPGLPPLPEAARVEPMGQPMHSGVAVPGLPMPFAVSAPGIAELPAGMAQGIPQPAMAGWSMPPGAQVPGPDQRIASGYDVPPGHHAAPAYSAMNTLQPGMPQPGFAPAANAPAAYGQPQAVPSFQSSAPYPAWMTPPGEAVTAPALAADRALGGAASLLARLQASGPMATGSQPTMLASLGPQPVAAPPAQPAPASLLAMLARPAAHLAPQETARPAAGYPPAGYPPAAYPPVGYPPAVHPMPAPAAAAPQGMPAWPGSPPARPAEPAPANAALSDIFRLVAAPPPPAPPPDFDVLRGLRLTGRA